MMMMRKTMARLNIRTVSGREEEEKVMMMKKMDNRRKELISDWFACKLLYLPN